MLPDPTTAADAAPKAAVPAPPPAQSVPVPAPAPPPVPVQSAVANVTIRGADGEALEIVADIKQVPGKGKDPKDRWDKLSAIGPHIVALTLGIATFFVNRAISNASLETARANTDATVRSTRITEVSKLATQLGSGSTARPAIIGMSAFGTEAVPVLLFLLEEHLDAPLASAKDAAKDTTPAAATTAKTAANPPAPAAAVGSDASATPPADPTLAVQRALEFIGQPAVPLLLANLQQRVAMLSQHEVDPAKAKYLRFVAERAFEINHGEKEADHAQALNAALKQYVEKVRAFTSNQEDDLAETNAAILRVLYRNGFDWKGVPFGGMYFKGIIRDVKFANADLRNAVFNGAIFSNCDFSGSNLHDANMKDARFGDNDDEKDRLVMLTSLLSTRDQSTQLPATIEMQLGELEKTRRTPAAPRASDGKPDRR